MGDAGAARHHAAGAVSRASRGLRWVTVGGAAAMAVVCEVLLGGFYERPYIPVMRLVMTEDTYWAVPMVMS